MLTKNIKSDTITKTYVFEVKGKNTGNSYCWYFSCENDEQFYSMLLDSGLEQDTSGKLIKVIDLDLFNNINDS